MKDFIDAVETIVNNTAQVCSRCGSPVQIVDSLIKCEGTCGYGAGIALQIDIEEQRHE